MTTTWSSPTSRAASAWASSPTASTGSSAGPNAGPVKPVLPYAFTFDNADGWIALFEWLRDNALTAQVDIPPDRDTITARFGPQSPAYERDIAVLKALYLRNKHANTIRVKTQLWRNLLMAALGEVASTEAKMDDLFVRHTYLTSVIGMVVQARFGIYVRERAENDPADLLYGREFHSATGLQGVVESDFFAWPTEVEGGLPFIKTLARRVARFDWQQAPNDVASILYETVIPPDERRQLGEYYTPDWLARTMVREVVTSPLLRAVRPGPCLRLRHLCRRGRHPSHRDCQGKRNYSWQGDAGLVAR